MGWYRVTFTRPGWETCSYNVHAGSEMEAFTIAQGRHIGRAMWVGGVAITPIEEPKPDLSFEMDDLNALAQELNGRHDDVPF